MLCSREWLNQEVDSGVVTEIAHQAKFITPWEPDSVGIEEGQDLETIDYRVLKKIIVKNR